MWSTLAADVRTSVSAAFQGRKNNVFGIQIGVAISFLVKTHAHYRKQNLLYHAVRNYANGHRTSWLFWASAKLPTIKFEEITPDKNSNWINLSDNDFDTLIPIASKETKAAKKPSQEKAIFKLFSLGVVTARDEWVYDYDPNSLRKRCAG